MSQTDGKRIAKNTLMLYGRTLLTLIISLYTSRLFLQILGVDNFGIYNVVGGTVGMLSLFTGSLNGAISRFITIAIGKQDLVELKRTFVTSNTIMVYTAIAIVVIGEIAGLWMLNCKLNIPPDRMYAANWVLQCSLMSFALGILSVPYSSCLIAHERMSVYATLGILDIVMKLLVLYLLYLSPYDKLIVYSLLFLGVSVISRIIVGVYCVKQFEECRIGFRLSCDKSITRKIAGFSFWNFLGSGAYLFSTQGVNILLNIYFGVVLNAARGIAAQVDGAVSRFVNDYMTALNPQITKSYAVGNHGYMYSLICRGTKFSYFIFLFFLIPIEIETETILSLWLTEVPDYAAQFLRLTLVDTIIVLMGQTALCGIFATGNIRNYEIVACIIAFATFPLTWLAFHFGLPPMWSYIIHILLFLALDIIRLFFLRMYLLFPLKVFLVKVIIPMVKVTVASFAIPLALHSVDVSLWYRLPLVIITSVLAVAASAYFIGCTREEKIYAREMVTKVIARIKRSNYN